MRATPTREGVVTQVAIDPEVRDNLLSECPGLSGCLLYTSDAADE